MQTYRIVFPGLDVHIFVFAKDLALPIPSGVVKIDQRSHIAHLIATVYGID